MRRASPGWRPSWPPTLAFRPTATSTAPRAWPSWTGYSPGVRPGGGSRSWRKSAPPAGGAGGRAAAGEALRERVLTRCPAGRRLPVLAEIGAAGGRTGCRTDAEAVAVARAAAAAHTLRLGGGGRDGGRD